MKFGTDTHKGTRETPTTAWLRNLVNLLFSPVRFWLDSIADAWVLRDWAFLSFLVVAVPLTLFGVLPGLFWILYRMYLDL